MDIGSKRIPFWINRKKHQMHVVRVVGPFQPFQGRIVLNQPEVHQGYRVWRDVSFARNSLGKTLTSELPTIRELSTDRSNDQRPFR